MCQQQDQGRNQKIPWNKWKWEHGNPKSEGYKESKPERGLSQEIRKSSNKQSNFMLKGTWKRTTNKAQSE